MHFTHTTLIKDLNGKEGYLVCTLLMALPSSINRFWGKGVSVQGRCKLLLHFEGLSPFLGIENWNKLQQMAGKNKSSHLLPTKPWNTTSESQISVFKDQQYNLSFCVPAALCTAKLHQPIKVPTVLQKEKSLDGFLERKWNSESKGRN